MGISLDIFEMYMDGLAAYLQTTVSKSVVEKDYWPLCADLDIKIIIKIIDWLKDNYSYSGFNIPRFPLRTEFDTAKMEVMRKINKEEYKPKTLPLNDNERDLTPEEKSEFCKEMIKRYPGNAGIKKNKLPSQVRLHKEMSDKEMVYSHELNKWVHKSLRNNIGGTFTEPKT
jgi:hypothetical protein